MVTTFFSSKPGDITLPVLSTSSGTLKERRTLVGAVVSFSFFVLSSVVSSATFSSPTFSTGIVSVELFAEFSVFSATDGAGVAVVSAAESVADFGVTAVVSDVTVGESAVVSTVGVSSIVAVVLAASVATVSVGEIFSG